jgi:hypothetical protein
MSDTFSKYKAGIKKLLEHMGQDHPRLSDLLVYEQRLMENIHQAQSYGDTETRRADRAQIVDGLNRLALETIESNFNELCRLDLGPGTAVAPPYATNKNYDIRITGGQGIVIGDHAQATTNFEQPSGATSKWDFIKHWLLVQFLLWTAVWSLSFISDLGSVLGLTFYTQLIIMTTLVILGAVVILSISFLPNFRAKYVWWDRGVTAVLAVIVVIILLFVMPQTNRSLSLIPQDTVVQTASTQVITPTSEDTAFTAAISVTQPVVLTETLAPSLPSENQSSVPDPEEETATAEFTPLICGQPHPQIAGSNAIAGDATIAHPVFTEDCLEVTQSHLFLEIRWDNATPGTELWLFVYSPPPYANLYYLHHCVDIQNVTGGQDCRASLGKLEPYDVVVIFADAAAHTDLLAIVSRGSGAEEKDLPTSIREMDTISVVRTK